MCQIVTDAVVRGPLSRFLNSKDGKRFLRQRREMNSYDKDASAASLQASMYNISILEALEEVAPERVEKADTADAAIDIWDEFPSAPYAQVVDGAVPSSVTAGSGEQLVMKRFDPTSGIAATLRPLLDDCAVLSRALPLRASQGFRISLIWSLAPRPGNHPRRSRMSIKYHTALFVLSVMLRSAQVTASSVICRIGKCGSVVLPPPP